MAANGICIWNISPKAERWNLKEARHPFCKSSPNCFSCCTCDLGTGKVCQVLGFFPKVKRKILQRHFFRELVCEQMYGGIVFSACFLNTSCNMCSNMWQPSFFHFNHSLLSAAYHESIQNLYSFAEQNWTKHTTELEILVFCSKLLLSVEGKKSLSITVISRFTDGIYVV